MSNIQQLFHVIPFLLSIFLFIFQVEGQCRYEYFSNFTDVCGKTDFVPKIQSSLSSSLNIPAVCSAFNETCYADCKECVQDSYDDFQQWVSAYETLQFVCSNLNDLATFQKCTKNTKFLQDQMICEQISQTANPPDFCEHMNKLITCYVNISRLYCLSEIFFCNFVETYFGILATANGCTYQDCNAARKNRWVVYAIVAAISLLIMGVATAVCCYSFRKLSWYDPYDYETPPRDPEDCSCGWFECRKKSKDDELGEKLLKPDKEPKDLKGATDKKAPGKKKCSRMCGCCCKSRRK